MTLFGYKEYQQRTLAALSDYLTQAREIGAKKAFVMQTERPYKAVPQLPGLPYVCLRVPTGGGKTVLACHAVALALRDFLRQERSVVLWLVPTNTIKDQTLNALRDRRHPYRQVLDATLEGKVTALGLADALAVPRATLDGETVVVVSTMAALRVENTEGRKVYEEAGALMSHFSGLPAEALAGLDRGDGMERPLFSLANVLKMRRPVVIVDEAHHLRTELSFETLARFDPSCILEFTATPHTGDSPSNVLYQVSAAELKAEAMVKLPIRLQLSGDWTEAVAAAIAKQQELEAVAMQEQAQTGRYLRPIVLLQAQPKNQSLTVEAVKERLLDSHVPAEQIAIETGAVHELNGDLFSPACPVRYIITVDKLREGWDCSFAYILCSVRDMNAKTPIEQILGRVLRMPNAERKASEDLNSAYAYVTSKNFRDVAEAVGEALTRNGFTKFEAKKEIEQGELDLGGLFRSEKAEPSPSQRGETFSVPQLALYADGDWEPVDETIFLYSGWKLTDYVARLDETEFASHITAEGYDFDVTKAGGYSIRQAEMIFVSDLQRQLALLTPNDIAAPAELAVWLDRHIPHPDIPQSQSSLFLINLLESLLTERGLTLEQLSRERLRLRDAAAKKINGYRKEATSRASQRLLFDAPPEELQTSAECVFTYAPDQYPANALYEGAYQFRKHYYPVVGEMNGEEIDCARVLENHPNVKYWVRNLERRPTTSFWLQTSTDKFYPDFVAILEDGRTVAVEYKGEDRITSDDSKEKRRLGELWEARSNGQCLFRFVGKNDFAQTLTSLAA